MTDTALIQELTELTDDDRRLQAGALGDDIAAQLAYRRVTTRNADRLTEILDQQGWPTVTRVGADARGPAAGDPARPRLRSSRAGAVGTAPALRGHRGNGRLADCPA